MIKGQNRKKAKKKMKRMRKALNKERVDIQGELKEINRGGGGGRVRGDIIQVPGGHRHAFDLITRHTRSICHVRHPRLLFVQRNYKRDY